MRHSGFWRIQGWQTKQVSPEYSAVFSGAPGPGSASSQQVVNKRGTSDSEQLAKDHQDLISVLNENLVDLMQVASGRVRCRLEPMVVPSSFSRCFHRYWNYLTCSEAAGGDHLEVLQWARVNGCPEDSRNMMIF